MDMADLNQIAQALDELVAHDAASRIGFDERTTVRAWTRTETRRRYHFDIDIAVIRDLLANNG